ncbi:MAG TPA: GntR family transcriptional regulator [Rubrobacteraceae bacterium]|nr:GntR family transcriptional regulator [Rubrobacteraceae bacterium]
MGAALRRGEERPGSSAVFERLRRMILEGEYGPRERLIEEQLAERLGVSRTPIRQALTMLEAEGLVEIEPNKGAMVCTFGVDEVWDIYDLRAVLEGHAARRAAERIDERGLVRLRELAGEMENLVEKSFEEREEEIRLLVTLNNEFHGTIVEASRNRRLERMIRRTVELPLVFKAFFWYTPRERMVSNHYHRQILGALEKGDGERAEIVMREHVYEGRDFVIHALEEDRKGEKQ